ncbi:MAG: AI-2E family transporter [Sandaracinaceae bacterium]
MTGQERRWSLPPGGWVLVGGAAVAYALYAFSGVLTPIFLAFLVAYVLDPIVDFFEARGLHRAVAIVVLLFLVLLAVAAVLGIVVPSVIQQVIEFERELPQQLERLQGQVEPWLTARGIPVPHSLDEAVNLLGSSVAGEGGGSAEVATRAAAVGEMAIGWVLGGTNWALAVGTTVILVPVFAFYLLYDFDRIVAAVRELIPWRHRPFVADVAQEVDEVLGQWVRGQFLVMVVLAVMYSAGYALVGVRLAVPIGIVAGLVSFIPYVGGALALLMALTMCLLHWTGWGQVVGVLVVYTVVQSIEGFFITPRVVGDRVGLASVWVLVALLIGGEAFGFLGVLLAVPAAAVIKIFVLRAVQRYRESRYYRDGGPPDSLLPPALAGVLEAEGAPDSVETAVEKAVARDLDHRPGVGPGRDESSAIPPGGPEDRPAAAGPEASHEGLRATGYDATTDGPEATASGPDATTDGPEAPSDADGPEAGMDAPDPSTEGSDGPPNTVRATAGSPTTDDAPEAAALPKHPESEGSRSSVVGFAKPADEASARQTTAPAVAVPAVVGTGAAGPDAEGTEEGSRTARSVEGRPRSVPDRARAREAGTGPSAGTRGGREPTRNR